MKPGELIKGTWVRTQYTKAPVREGRIVERVLQSGVASFRGKFAVVEFSNGSTAQLAHWQLDPAEDPKTCGVITGPSPPAGGSQPAPSPASCLPPKAPSWKDDVRVGALYLNLQPNGMYSLSLVVTDEAGTSKQAVRLIDLASSDLEGEITHVASKLARFASSHRP